MRKSRAFAAAFMLCFLLAVFTGCSAEAVGDVLGTVFWLRKQAAEDKYSNPTDRWRNETVFEFETSDAINWLLGAADLGDRSGFAELFAPVIVNNEKFSAQLDSFFERYPVGLSECELDGGFTNGGGDYYHGDVEEHQSARYTCFLGDEWYYMDLSYCYQNTKAPDEVGITFFCIENLEANALDREYSENDHLACRIADESEVTARLINNRGFVFEPTPERSITLEQMREYLEKCDSLSDVIEMIGEPNAAKKIYNATGNDYYYELTSDNDSPLYAHIVTHSPYGRMLYGYICSDKDTLYDVFLMEDRTKKSN